MSIAKDLSLIFSLGRPLSPLYGLLMKLREKCYLSEIFPRHSLPIPVISVGNLVLGGTGKTPTVEHIASLLLKKGFSPAIVSRGYRGKAKQAVNVVSNGKDILLSSTLAGDEPYLLAKSLPMVPVLTAVKRILACRHAIEQFNVDVLIIDDGFQHLAIKRDIDIVLFDGTVLSGNSRIFPGGPLREPISALNRCQAFLITGKTEYNQHGIKRFMEILQLRFPTKPVYSSCVNNLQLFSADGESCPGIISGKFYSFCGIANPTRFIQSLHTLGINLVGSQTLKDHTPYNQSLVANIGKKAAKYGAEKMVTTEKDFVKLQHINFNLPLYILKTKHRVDHDFDSFLLKALARINAEIPP